jgi:hypothetical protein
MPRCDAYIVFANHTYGGCSVVAANEGLGEEDHNEDDDNDVEEGGR